MICAHDQIPNKCFKIGYFLILKKKTDLVFNVFCFKWKPCYRPKYVLFEFEFKLLQVLEKISIHRNLHTTKKYKTVFLWNFRCLWNDANLTQFDATTVQGQLSLEFPTMHFWSIWWCQLLLDLFLRIISSKTKNYNVRYLIDNATIMR